MIVEVKGVTKYYGKQAAVKDLTFTLKKGEILGFLGPNGAGKTTTMKMISGYLYPSQGTISLDNYDIYHDALDIRKHIGYLPEHNPLYLDMYVKEFLGLMGKVHQISPGERKRRIDEVIAMTGLEREQHKRIQQLSKGYRQRVGLGQAILHNPSVLILDEPTTGLDPNQIVDIRDLIRDLGKDKSILFSSHILSEVEAIADRIIIINKGQMVADEEVKEISRNRKQEVVISVEFETEGFDFTAVKAHEAVNEVVEFSPKEYKINTSTTVDIRPFLFQECVKQGNVILSLQKELYTLEDTFRSLTK